MQLPANTSHLCLVDCESGDCPPTLMTLNILSKQHPLCNNIKCIEVHERPTAESASTSLDTPKPQADWRNIESSQARFSSLHSLTLEGVASEVTEIFRHLQLPHLEFLKLSLMVDTHPTIEDVGQLEPIPVTSLESDEPKFDFQILVPHLLTLKINQAESSFVAFLGLFRGQSVESVSLRNWTLGRGPKSEFELSHTAQALSNFRTRDLKLLGFEVPLISFIITSMDSQLLQSLVIQFDEHWQQQYSLPSFFSEPWGNKRRRKKNTIFEWYQSKMDFALPLLASLRCEGTCRQFAEFLARLDASRLTHLHMNFKILDEESRWHSPPYPGQLPSVRFVTFRFGVKEDKSSYPTLMRFRNLLPNVEELRLIGWWYKSKHSLRVLCRDGEGKPPQDWRNTLLWDYLGITPDGSALFPRLRSLIVQHRANWKRSEIMDCTLELETVYRYIQGLLTLRHRYGAVPLTLDEPPKYIPPHFTDAHFNEGRMKFSAHYQSDG